MSIDLLGFFPVWGKSIMDSIEDRKDNEEQIVSINMEDSMDGGRGKKKTTKKSKKY